jgi:transcriptional regulator with XRE-family HTH domain
MNLGSAIRKIRIVKNLKQQDLAALLDMSQTALSLIESGKTWPSKKTLFAIADKTNTPLDIVFLMAIDREAIPSEYLQMIKPLVRNIAGQYLELTTAKRKT